MPSVNNITPDIVFLFTFSLKKIKETIKVNIIDNLVILETTIGLEEGTFKASYSLIQAIPVERPLQVKKM